MTRLQQRVERELVCGYHAWLTTKEVNDWTEFFRGTELDFELRLVQTAMEQRFRGVVDVYPQLSTVDLYKKFAEVKDRVYNLAKQWCVQNIEGAGLMKCPELAQEKYWDEKEE